MARRPPLDDAAVRRLLANATELAGGQRAWAAQHGLSQGAVAKAATGRNGLSPRILGALGLRALPPAYAPVETRQ